ncbi:uncharacterized protein LOC144134665 [Amblyomma americanum]
MFVLVQYEGEDKRYVVSDADVRNFAPHDIDDFERGKPYDVFWAGNTTTRGGFYKATIVHMTETEEEMKTWRQNKRMASRKCSSKDGPPRKKSKLNFQARALAKRSAEDELAQTSEMEGTEGTSKAISLQSKVADLEARVKELEGLNKELQKALCAKVLNMDSCVLECGHGQPSSHRAQPGPPRAAVPGHASWVQSQSAHGSSASQAKPSSPLPQLAVDPAPFPDVNPADEARLPKAVGPTAQVDNTVGITNEAGEVHAGHGSYVPVAAWNRLLALGSDSTFCKQLAVCLWGNEILAQRSLTGTLSNNAISKGMTKIHPPLSPLKVASVSDSFRYYLMLKGCPAEELSKRHKKVVRYLAQKCCDLRRQDKTAFEPQEPAARSLQLGACSQEPACSQGSVHEQVLKKA